MLVLGRMRGEKILIGDDLSVTLEDVKGRGVAITVQEGVRFPYRKHLRGGERFQLAPDVFLQVLKVRSSQVRFGLLAPLSVRILREEVLANPREMERLFGPDLGGEAGGA